MAASPIIYVSVGTLTNGRPAMVAPEVRTWWALFQRLVWLKLGVRIEIVQAKGAGSLSGGTHHLGDAFDWRTWKFLLRVILEIVRLAREAGAPATWYRTRAQGFDPHIHAVIDIGRLTPATYQIAAVKRRRNGLGRGGNAGADDGPRPSRWRNYREGILWMQAQIAAHDTPGTPTNKPTQEDTLSAAEVAEIKAHIDARVESLMKQLTYMGHNLYSGEAETKLKALVRYEVRATIPEQAEATAKATGAPGAASIDYARIDKAIKAAIGATTVTTTTTLGSTK